MKTVTEKVLTLFVLFFSLPLLGYAQDCCGPGGGGGGTQFIDTDSGGGNAGSGSDVHYRLKGVRHYAYSGRHPGFTLGLESAGLTDKSKANFTPRVEYFTSLQANEKNSFDIYGAAFYTVFIDAPHSHQFDLSENIAWRFAVTDKSRFVFRIDNEDLFVYFPNESGIKYAAIDPSIGYVHALSFGDISFYSGFPVYIKPETVSSLWICAGYEHPIGLGVMLCPRFELSPDAAYTGTTFTLSFVWDTFYAKMALLANGKNGEDTLFHIQPYFEYTLNHFVFWAGFDMYNIGKKEFSTNLFIGAGYNF